MKNSIRDLKNRLHALAVSRRGRNTLTFLVFLMISTAFWFIMELNNEVQHEFDVPMVINDVPEDVTLLSSVPGQLSVDVKDKGISLIRWTWGNIPTLEIDYSQLQNNGRYLSLNNTQLTGAVRTLFGGGANITDVRPDSLYISFTTNPGVKRRVNIIADVSPSPQHTLSGSLKLSVDTVKVFSASAIPASLKVVTDSIILTGVTDTTYVDVRLKVPEGIKVIPSTVRVMIPVEPLIMKTRNIPVEVINSPPNVKILTFPSTVEVTYTVPISTYNHDNYTLKAYAVYDSLYNKLPLTVSSIPTSYRNISLATDSVEFLVERRFK